MERRKIQLILGGLFHDIGKVLYRYDDGRNHSASGYDYMKEKNSGLNDKEILDQIRFHHAKELRGAELDDDSLAYITYWADNVASGADRRSKDEESDYGAYDKYDKYVPLETKPTGMPACSFSSKACCAFCGEENRSRLTRNPSLRATLEKICPGMVR